MSRAGWGVWFIMLALILTLIAYVGSGEPYRPRPKDCAIDEVTIYLRGEKSCAPIR